MRVVSPTLRSPCCSVFGHTIRWHLLHFLTKMSITITWSFVTMSWQYVFPRCRFFDNWVSSLLHLHLGQCCSVELLTCQVVQNYRAGILPCSADNAVSSHIRVCECPSCFPAIFNHQYFIYWLRRATYLTNFGAIVDILVWTLEALSTSRKVKLLMAVLTLNLHNWCLSQG